MRIKYLLIAAVVALMTACGTASEIPLIGRTHRIGISDAQLPSLSNQEYTKLMASAKRPTNVKNAAMVQRIGHSLTNTVRTYLYNNGYTNGINNFKWEFNLVQDRQANTFCMPGGKIVVYEGLLPYTQGEAGLAIVLGREIARAVAKHSVEQITKQMNQQMGTNILGTVLNSTIGSGVGDIASWVAGGCFSFRSLKYSRDSESEAGYVGFISATMAEYDPASTITFWQRMAAATNNNRSEILSNRPSDARRIENIKKWLSEAEKYYRGRGSSHVSSAGCSQSSRTLHIGGSSSSERSNRR